MNINRVFCRNSEAPALTDGVVFNSPVTAKNVTVQVDDVARKAWLIAENHVKIFFPDKILAFCTVCGVKICLMCKLKNLALFHKGKRKADFFQSFTRNPVEEVSLVFRYVGGTGNHAGALVCTVKSLVWADNAGIMSRTKIIEFNSALAGCFQHGAKLNVAVTHNAWIWSAAAAVFAFKIFQNLFLILLFYVHNVVFNIMFRAEFFTFFNIFFFARAVAGFFHGLVRFYFGELSVPEGHCNSDYAAALLLEHQSGQG